MNITLDGGLSGLSTGILLIKEGQITTIHLAKARKRFLSILITHHIIFNDRAVPYELHPYHTRLAA